MIQTIAFPLAIGGLEAALIVGGVIVGAGLGFLVMTLIQKSADGKRLRAAAAEAEALRNKAQTEAETIRTEAQRKGEQEIERMRSQFEARIEEQRNELRQSERRLEKREDNLDQKADDLAKTRKDLERQQEQLAEKEAEIRQKDRDLSYAVAEQKNVLLTLSGFTSEQARDHLMQRLEDELRHEISQKIAAFEEKYKAESNRMARHILSTAIQRCAVDHTVDTVVSAIDIPNDAMKGRIIGREGRNIRSFEKSTGVDVIVDDTPGVIVISEFEPVRREVARRSMEKLVADGRIHPGRIEEVVKSTRKELDEEIEQIGTNAVLDADVRGLHPKMISLLGRLAFRTSYGQNVLQHSLEVCHLAGVLAGEMGIDAQKAKRCGLLHDIGKAVDHEIEGGHPDIGADLCKRYDESPEVINAAAAHHEGKVSPSNIYTILISAADAVSAARPGARRESLEKYIKRLERLEEIANNYPGVEKTYAIQAGREIRVVVDSDRIGDDDAAQAARTIAKQIEEELAYPGEIKVTLLREKRVIEYAR